MARRRLNREEVQVHRDFMRSEYLTVDERRQFPYAVPLVCLLRQKGGQKWLAKPDTIIVMGHR